LNSRLLALGLTTAALLSLGWWLRQFMEPPVMVRQTTQESPSAIVEQLKVRGYDMTGRLEQILVTPHMEHFESSNTSELSEPVLWRFDPDTPPWRMQAEQALANNEEKLIFLPGEVIIDRYSDEQNPPYHIVTQDLTLETESGRATTEAAVRIESNQQWVTAIGMEGWLKSPIKLNLQKQVRGYYVFE
jgi:lipopolysaccharide export system protein LptC